VGRRKKAESGSIAMLKLASGRLQGSRRLAGAPPRRTGAAATIPKAEPRIAPNAPIHAASLRPPTDHAAIPVTTKVPIAARNQKISATPRLRKNRRRQPGTWLALSRDARRGDTSGNPARGQCLLSGLADSVGSHPILFQIEELNIFLNRRDLTE
jgi:hypothetical protein